MAELDTRLPLAIQPGRAPNIPQFLGQIGLLDQQRQRRTLNELLIDKARQQQIQDAIAAQQAQQIQEIEQGANVGAAGLPGAPVVPPVGTVGAMGIPQAAGAAGTVGAPSVGTTGQVPGQGPDAAEEALIGRLTQAGQFSQALARQKQLDEKRTRRADLRAKQGANLREDMELTGRILTGVMQRSPGQQQAAYQGELPRLRGLARKHGLEAERLFPDNFDAGTVQQRLTESQETKTRVSAIIDAANAESAASRARTAAAKEEREAAEGTGQLRDFGGTPTFNQKAGELFPDKVGRLSGPEIGQINDVLQAEKAQAAVQMQAAVQAGVAEARAQNIQLTPIQVDKAINRSEILGIAETIKKEFSDKDLRAIFGARNIFRRGVAAAKGNPKILRLLSLTGRLRSALLFDREKGGGGALTPNEQTALESAIPTGRELTAEAFIQKRDIMNRVAGAALNTFLDASLGRNPTELARMRALLTKQRRAFEAPTFAEDTPKSLIERGKALLGR